MCIGHTLKIKHPNWTEVLIEQMKKKKFVKGFLLFTFEVKKKN